MFTALHSLECRTAVMSADASPERCTTSSQYTDWILFPELCRKGIVASSTKIALVADESNNENRQPLTQHPLTRTLSNMPGHVIEPHSNEKEAFIEGRWPISIETSPMETPPRRPSPQRLMTPDLPEIDEIEYWTCSKRLRDHESSLKGMPNRAPHPGTRGNEKDDRSR